MDKVIKFRGTVKSPSMPEDKNVVWIDISDSEKPITKIYILGEWKPISSVGGDVDIKVDTEMSNNSTNPVANKTIKEYVDLHPRYRKVDEIEVPDIDVPSTGDVPTTVKLPMVYMYPETTEQLNHNIEIYNGVKEGKINAIVGDGLIYTAILDGDSVDFGAFLANMMLMYSINPDGTIIEQLYIPTSIPYITELPTSYEGVHATIQEGFLLDDYYFVDSNNLYIGLLKGIGFPSKETINNETRFYFETVSLLTNEYYTVIYNPTETTYRLVKHKNAIVRLSYTTAINDLYEANKMIFPDSFFACKLDTSLIIKDGDNKYATLSLTPIYTDTEITAFDVVIYNNGFKTYRINSDGTTTLLNS